MKFIARSFRQSAAYSIWLVVALACSGDTKPVAPPDDNGGDDAVGSNPVRPEQGGSTGNASGSGGRAGTGGSSGGSTPSGSGGAGGTNAGSGGRAGSGTTSSEGPLIQGDAPTAQSAAERGPFEVTTLRAGLRDGDDYGTQTLYFPRDAEPPFAGVAIVPGLGEDESSIADWGPFLASHGILALTIGTNDVEDSVEERANALLDALETIKAEDTRSGGPLQGKVATDRFAIMGWSMGGGATLVASSRTPSLKAAITLAAWNDGGTFEDEQVPTLLFAGSADMDAGGQSQDFFESIPASTPKMLFEVEGGVHTIANSPSGAGGAVGRYGLSWLKVFLEEDERYRPLLLEEPSEASDFRENLSSR